MTVDATKLAGATHLRDIGHTIAEIVTTTGIPRTSFYRYLPPRAPEPITAAGTPPATDPARTHRVIRRHPSRLAQRPTSPLVTRSLAASRVGTILVGVTAFWWGSWEMAMRLLWTIWIPRCCICQHWGSKLLLLFPPTPRSDRALDRLFATLVTSARGVPRTRYPDVVDQLGRAGYDISRLAVPCAGAVIAFDDGEAKLLTEGAAEPADYVRAVQQALPWISR